MGEVALKIDISMAYDRVEREYVKKVMRRVESHDRRVNWMTTCMQNVSYEVLVNGEIVRPNYPQIEVSGKVTHYHLTFL